MKLKFVLGYVLFFTGQVIAQENGQYAVSKIPGGLLKNADAVVRDYDQRVEVVSPGEVNIISRYAVTILNKDAGHLTALSVGYDKTFDEIEDISGALYDKNGDEIKKLKRIDIIDAAAYREMLEFDNVRVKHFDFNHSGYPITVLFEIKRRRKGSFYIPGFSPQMDKHFSVEKASMEIVYPADLPVRYKTFHLKEQPVISASGDSKKLTIAVADINAKKNIALEPEDAYSLPSAIFTCDSFVFGGISGKMDTWKAFGKFFYDLNANRDDLSDDMKKTVHKLTDTCRDDLSKIKTLYEYLQKSTRYVAVEMGIGGWQCLDAKSVCVNKYADCKGLANYMGAMLKEAGINSYCVLIYGGRDDRIKLQRDFTSNAFNHVILCVPRDKDTLWMDCTSKTDPAGYLSEFTNDRDALLITPDGGFILRMPVYGVKENTAVRNVSAHINSHDSIDAVLKLRYVGYLRNEEAPFVTEKHKQEIEDHFNSKFSLAGCKVSGYQIAGNVSGNVPSLYEEVSLAGSGKVSHAGKRTFIEPAILPLNIPAVSNTESRISPFELRATFSVSDTETITIDGVYTVEYIPEDIDLNYRFASYNCKIFFEKNNILMIVRNYTQIKGIYPADLFSDYAVLTKATNVNGKKIVLLQKD